MSPPNIVLLLSDQHNPRVSGHEGDRVVRTPNLDALAGGGTSLRTCYCPSPLCVPSRMSMLTSLLPSRTGVFTNHDALRSDRATFVHGLAAGGYQTVLCGRMHFVGPDQRHGYQQRLVGDLTPATPYWYGSGQYGYLHGTSGMHRVALDRAGPGDSNVLHYDADVTDAACAFLRDRRDERPLFLTVGFYLPHCPYVCPPELFEYYYRRLPPEVPGGIGGSDHPAIQAMYDACALRDVQDQSVRRARAAYYGMCELLDRNIGQVLAAVGRTLDADNTLVVYLSDHGDTLGRHGMFWKRTFYEGSVRVPALFHWPGVVPAGRRIDSPTSLLDVGPTLLEMSGGPSLPVSDGQSLWPVLAGRNDAPADRAVVSELTDFTNGPSAMLRLGDYKLVRYAAHAEPMLFNLADDPDEEHDLAGDERHAEARRRLEAELAERWDPAVGQAACRHTRAHVSLLKAAGERNGAHDDVERWPGRDEWNYLTDRPESRL